MASLAQKLAFEDAAISVSGFSCTPRDDVMLASIAPWAGKYDEVSRKLKERYGLDLPAAGLSAGNDSMRLIWGGEGLWYALGARVAGRDLEVELKSLLSGVAAIVDHSDGRAIVRVSGARTRDVLAKGIPIDLHARAFKPGQVAITHASHIGVILWQVDDKPTYDIAMFRSFSGSFVSWLKHSV